MSAGRLAVLALLAAGCAHPPQRALTPVPALRDVAIEDSGPAAPVRTVTPCVLQRIVDGDSITCRHIGAVRLIGVDSPERDQEPFAAAATQALVALAPLGDTLQLEPDVDAHDRYGRVLAYVWRDGVLLNWLMLRHGWAVVLTVPPNVQFVDYFTAAQERARNEQRGLWQVDGFRCLPSQRRRRVC